MRFFVPVAVLSLGFLASTAFAQTDESLLLTPWEKGKNIEARADAYIFPEAHLGNGAGSLGFFESEIFGRYRLDLGYEMNPSVGYDWTYLNLNQTSRSATAPRLDRPLNDASIAIGSPITKVGDNGFLAATAGIGYAGDAAFAEGRAWYGKGSIMYGYRLHKGTDVLILLDYNGNRSVLPDTPLPAFAYSSRYDERLAYVVGFPVNSLLWNPTTTTKVVVNWYVPDSLSARGTWELSPHSALFAGYDQRRNQFRTREIQGDNRLFFSEQRMEVGYKFEVIGVRVEVAGGYAFGRSFDQGYDSRDLHRLARVGDEPFVRLSLGISR